MRRYIILMMVIMMMHSCCLAMTFSQPKEVGSVGGNPCGGFSIDGPIYNNGTSFRNGKFDDEWGKLYEKGVALFGLKDKPLYVYYDCSSSGNKKYWDLYSPTFGNKDKSVTVKLGAGEGDYVRIQTIKNDGNITLYLLTHTGCVVGLETYVLMGYDRNGKFVKYIDTRTVVDNYLGKNNFGQKGIFLGKYYCKENMIVVEYLDSRSPKGYDLPVGEFRFKWDDNAQWFGVEHIKY